MVVTDEESVWKRTNMYHDVIGALQLKFSVDELLCGVNYRMPELLAAVALPQLERLDGLIDDMRHRKRMIKAGIEGVAERKGIGFREMADPEGDTAIATVFFVDSPEKAASVSEALRAENIGAGTLYSPDDIDYHVYAHWVPIMNQRTWTRGRRPMAQCKTRD